MLYVTTRNNTDAYTCARAIRESRGGDGGLYVPFRLPVFSAEEIAAMGDKSFSAGVAEMLNLLFNCHLNSWDVEFCAGRYPVRLTNVSQKVLIAESWHNVDGTFTWMVHALTTRLCKEKPQLTSGNWVEIGVRMAVIAGIFAELIRSGMASSEKKVDICVVSGDFSAPMSAWYAREMGLPIGNIICTCNENNGIWDLMHHGQMRTDLIAVSTNTPDADVALPVSLERLIHFAGGSAEVGRYLDVCRRGGMYCPDDWILGKMRRGMFVSVVGQRRVTSTIPSVFGTNGYVLSPYGALAYSGLLDYRVRTGESRHALVLAEKSPMRDALMTADALGVPEKELERYL